GEEDVIALNALAEDERASADGRGLRVRPFEDVLVLNVQVLEEVEQGRARLLGLEHDGVLVGRLDGRPPFALLLDLAIEALATLDAAQVVLDVGAGEFSPRVVLDTFAQV